MGKIKKILYILAAAAIIGAPAFALPENLPQLEPVNVEQNAEYLNEPFEQSVEIKPSSGEIEKNSFQEPYDKSDLKDEVVPKSQSELFRVVAMFVKVMAAVLLSAGLIYLILLVYRKYCYRGETDEYDGPMPQSTGSMPEISGDLKSPQDENEALKNFLNQTKNR